MAIKRLQLELNSDIYDKVIAFINKLPKNKVKLIPLPDNKELNDDIFLETSGLLASKKIDPIKWQKEIRSEWDRQ